MSGARRDALGDIPRIAGQGNGGLCRPERGARSVGDVTTHDTGSQERDQQLSPVNNLEREERGGRVVVRR